MYWLLCSHVILDVVMCFATCKITLYFSSLDCFWFFFIYLYSHYYVITLIVLYYIRIDRCIFGWRAVLTIPEHFLVNLNLTFRNSRFLLISHLCYFLKIGQFIIFPCACQKLMDFKSLLSKNRLVYCSLNLKG